MDISQSVHQIINHVKNLKGDQKDAALSYLKRLLVRLLNETGTLLADEYYNYSESVNYLKFALTIEPQNWIIACNIAEFLHANDEWVEASKYAEMAVDLSGGKQQHVWLILGIIYGHLEQYDKCIEAYRHAIDLSNEPGQAHFNIAPPYLRLGQWDLGWRHYEYRLQVFPEKIIKTSAGIIPVDRFVGCNRYKGGDLEGKTVYVHHDQGFGDFFNWCRFIPWIKSCLHAKQIILECPRIIVPLIDESFGVDRIIEYDTKGPDIIEKADCVLSVCSLPGLFCAGAKPMPEPPYLKSPIEFPEIFKTDTFKVGICWAGNPKHEDDYRRSCHLDNFLKLAMPGVTLFSLQMGSCIRKWHGKEVNLGSGDQRVVDLSKYLKDFAWTAAAIVNLDLVITVDTSVAHLAGAMGKPVWLLVDKIGDWRWAKIEWYPNMRIFRQPTLFDWQSVFEEIEKELINTI